MGAPVAVSRDKITDIKKKTRRQGHEFSRKQADLWASGPTMGNPAWYYGMRTDEDRRDPPGR